MKQSNDSIRTEDQEPLMPRRLAAACALIVFAACLFAGMRAGNTFSTTVSRAVLAMGATLVIGLVAGAMLERALGENVSEIAKNSGNSGTDSSAGGR
jgi:hypothetical protein